jgi:putative ABC transport system permease protein
MISPHSIWYRARALVQKRAVTRDVDNELAFHIEMETEQLVAAGVGRAEARARAMRRFGDATRVREECIDERGVRPLEDFAQDLRVGARMLRRSPGIAAVSVITLAVGLAAATTIFSVIDGVLLKPLAYEDSGRLVTLRQRSLTDGTLDDAAPGNFIDWRERTRTLERLSAAVPFSMDYRTDAGMISLPVWLVSNDFFALVGTPARLGRTFRPEEFVPGSDRVIVLGDALWRDRFAADSSIVGKSITLDGAPFVVVGVMPRGFRWPRERDAWAPLTITDEERTVRRLNGWWSVLGRLRPGTTIDGARREMSIIASDLAATYPATNRDTGIEVTALEDALLGTSRGALATLAGAVVLLLLIACANVANIVLGRSIARAREFAIRGAMGARPSRLGRQMITEVLIVAALGTVLGVVAATWALDLVRTLGPRDIPRIDELAIDARVLAFAAIAAVLVAVLAGALPAIWVARGNLSEALREGGRTSTSGPRTRTIRGALAIGQVTMATILLVGAGLLTRSLVSLLRVDRGYDTTNVVVASVQTWQHYRELAQRAEFVRQALDRLRAIPGVRAVGVTSSLPLSDPIGADDAGFLLEGQARPTDSEWPSVHLAVIGGSYFDAMSTPMRRGRKFDDRDRANTTPVMIVNAAFARRYFPNEDPIGRRVVIRFTRMTEETPREIVGVVGDMRHEGLHAEPHPSVFVPHAQLPFGALNFVVRARNNPGAALRATRAELTTLNSAMPIEDPTTLDARLAESLRARRFHLALLVTFAVSALVLAAVGVYGVVSHATEERTHEIGVRMALGAQARSIVSAVMRSGLTLVVIGILLGAIGAAVAGGALSAMLFGTTAHDTITYVVVVLVLVATSVLATAVPAARATRVTPTEALRG